MLRLSELAFLISLILGGVIIIGMDSIYSFENYFTVANKYLAILCHMLEIAARLVNSCAIMYKTANKTN